MVAESEVFVVVFPAHLDLKCVALKIGDHLLNADHVCLLLGDQVEATLDTRPEVDHPAWLGIHELICAEVLNRDGLAAISVLAIGQLCRRVGIPAL